MPILSLKRNIISLYPISLYNNSITTFRWAPPLSGYWRPPKAGKNNHQANERGYIRWRYMIFRRSGATCALFAGRVSVAWSVPSAQTIIEPFTWPHDNQRPIVRIILSFQRGSEGEVYVKRWPGKGWNSRIYKFHQGIIVSPPPSDVGKRPAKPTNR